MGGVTLVYEVARQLGATAIFTEPVYEAVVVEPNPDGTLYTPLMHSTLDGRCVARGAVQKTGQELKRFDIPEGATILFVEDVITTGKSTREMFEAVCGKRDDLNILPYVLCLVNRSGLESVPDCTVAWKPGSCLTEGAITTSDWPTIISLADVQARTWDTIEEAETDLTSSGELSFSEIKSLTSSCGLGGFRMEAVRPKDNWDLLTKGQ